MLAPNPGEALNTDAVQVDLVTLNREQESKKGEVGKENPRPSSIVEAKGWMIDGHGNVILTANAPTVTPYSSWQTTADCRAFNQQQEG